MDPIEQGLGDLLARLRSNHEATHGPGSFAQAVQKGRLMMAKKAHELTEGEAAFLRAPPPAKQS